MKVLANGPVFTILYLIFMIPTYFLPYVGSNSAVIGAAGMAVEAGVNPAFWLHLGSLLVLIVITWLRASFVNKNWIVVFPVLATVFDLVPGLNIIPFVPTVMHLCAIIVGVSSQKNVSQTPAT